MRFYCLDVSSFVQWDAGLYPKYSAAKGLKLLYVSAYMDTIGVVSEVPSKYLK